ncbi:MAG: NAD(P)H-dependent glycerol-3-phosphate dehydrogenase [Sporomusaceae bacterium]|nr:NAD(P)H-dependent glycerol-3-phosphate dehydrogenase [Sporomusaceae bacterium]
MNVSVLGCGRWGTFLAWYANKIGHTVTLWGRESSRNYLQLNETRTNDYLTLPHDIRLSNSLEGAVSSSEIIIISISAQELGSLAQQLSLVSNTAAKIFVLCMKGLEASSGKRLSQVFREAIGSDIRLGIWVGPGHVQDYIKNIPNCMVIDSDDIEVTKTIVNQFSSDLIRLYYGSDLLGNEIGAAAKNVMGIAAGMLDGLHYSSLKGALMARGTREMSRLVTAMGGNHLTIYGLSHLGDYEATLFSQHSHNRKFGQACVTGEIFDKLAEGVATVQSLKHLSQKYEVDLPICNAVYNILFENKDAKETLFNLFLRPVTFE